MVAKHTLTGVPAGVQKGLEALSKRLIRVFTVPTYSPYPIGYAYPTVMIQRNRPAVLNDLAHINRCARGALSVVISPHSLHSSHWAVEPTSLARPAHG